MSNYSDEALLRAIGGKIRSLRMERNMSLKDLAYSIGMEASNLSVIENGKSNPQLLTYAKIAAALHITLQDLFTLDFDFQAFAEDPGEYTPRKHK
jgi:putative transcriptional regulator